MEMSVPDEGTKPRSAMEEYKPLGLPIRSLRSTKVEHTDTQQESSDQRTWSSSVEVEKEKEKVKGLVPVNLEKQFREASAIPWKRSPAGSGRRKKRVAESESFWAPVLSENSPLLPYSSKSMKETREDGKNNLKGRGSLSRGKSVRTIRKSSNGHRESSSPTQNDEKGLKRRDPHPEVTCDEVDADAERSSNAIDEEVEEEEEESVERGDWAEKGVDVDGDGDGDEDDEGKEVDRKADEFIAKFREQIRLQKINSARGFKHW